jgi:hypothetical protein
MTLADFPFLIRLTFRIADGPGRMGTRDVATAELTECNWLMPQFRVF